MDDFWHALLEIFSDINTNAIQRRGIINAFLPSMLQSGLSARHSHKIFRENSLGIDNNEYSSINKDIRNWSYINKDLFYLPSNAEISEDNLRIGNNSFDTKYKTVFSYGVSNADGYFLYNTTHGLDSSILGNKAEMENLAMQDIIERYPHLDGIVHSVTLRSAYYNDTV